MRRLCLTAGLLVLAGCPSNMLVSPPGNGAIKDLTPAATGSADSFHTPLDATLSPDGKMAFFIAIEGDLAAVYSASAPANGAPTKLHAGEPLVSPFGVDISFDGKTLILSDPGAQLNADADERGELFSLSTTGGAPQKIDGASGYRARGVAVVRQAGADLAFFTGRDPATKEPGVFKVPLAGGAVTVVAKGGELRDLSGLAVVSDGTVFVVDADAEGGDARLMKISGGTVSVMKSPISVGFPAGVALSQDEKTVLVSARVPEAGTDAVLRIPVGGGDTEVVTTGIDQFSEPAGLHRARSVDAFIWADSRANGKGTVFVINKQQ